MREELKLAMDLIDEADSEELSRGTSELLTRVYQAIETAYEQLEESWLPGDKAFPADDDAGRCPLVVAHRVVVWNNEHQKYVVCGRGKLRRPTPEELAANWPGALR